MYLNKNWTVGLLSLMLATHASTAVSEPTKVSLGVATNYNAFIFEDFSAPWSDTGGRMAIGGNLSLNNYSVADALSADEAGLTVVVGGDFNFPSGRIYYGHALVAGSAEGVGEAVRYGLANDQLLLDGIDSPIDFDKAKLVLTQHSGYLSQLPTNGVVENRWGGLYLAGDCSSDLQVFHLDGPTVLNAHTFDVSCIPNNATVVFNISGTAPGLRNMSLESIKPHRTRVLFNFYEAEQVELASIGVEGSILAPKANIANPSGVVYGTVVANSWSGSMHLEWAPFEGHNVSLNLCEGPTE